MADRLVTFITRMVVNLQTSYPHHGSRDNTPSSTVLYHDILLSMYVPLAIIGLSQYP